jgi:hypothetical protein
MKKAITIIIVLLAVPSGILFAYGGGGAFVGEYIYGFSWDTSEIDFTGIRYKGGFGYGVASGGHRVGGFGLSLYDYQHEGNLELGVKIFSWLQVSGFAGWQTLGKLFTFKPANPSDPFHPIAGFRVTWGSF